MCPLCQKDAETLFHKDKWREYLACANCHLIFVPPRFHLSTSDERAEYDLHENSPNDSGYRKFLGRIFEPIRQRIAVESCGLDFGSGPGPTLSVMFEELGHRMSVFDQFYAPDRSVLDHQYDFITVSEAVEHFRNPQKELETIWSCLRPGGLIGIMTKLALGKCDFEKWHYKNDRTHICFFSKATFRWLGSCWKSNALFVDDDVVLFEKPND